MALPIAAAVPLSVLQAVEPLMPAQFGPLAVSPRLVFLLGTLAGIPIAAYAIIAGWSLLQRRWKRRSYSLPRQYWPRPPWPPSGSGLTSAACRPSSTTTARPGTSS